ncbi:hypothetical protein D915_010762 [Fasciola hepatica]|uniref:Uncharacterized protein n=1 Tax=Fasciola hepatica TaxID=6192 RepID=A0A4E0RP74_FASHE|nr:hypothetical protein D915_010762 [Fasciola hepatica]
MELRATPDLSDGGHAASGSSHASQDDLSIEECERLVLSPPPVPMNMETACAAIYAAARRSNSSRTHSIKTQPHDGHSDTQSHPSELDLCKLKSEMSHDLSGSYHPGSLSRWRRLLCCFPDRAATITREGKHAQFHAPYTRSVTADHRGLGDADNGDSLIMPSHLGGSTKKARNRKLKLFPSKAVHDSKITNHNVASVHTHKIEMPITVDRYLQKPIPPSSSQSNTECIAVPSSAHTVQQQQNYRPTLPNYVLNSLVRTTEHPSSCLVGSPTANGHGVNDLDNRPGEFATQQTVHQSTTKPHSSFTITFPKLPGFRRPPLETTPLPSEMTSRDISVIPSSSSTMDHTTPTVYTNAGAVPYTMAHDEASLVPRLLPHGASWDSGDVEVNVPSDIDQADYHTVVDQNGGQGDSSSENLDTVSAFLYYCM